MTTLCHPDQRVAVLIDTQNLYHSAKHLYNKNVNFKNILADAVAERKLIRAIGYVISSESGEEQGFFEALEGLGIEPKTKDLQVFAGGAKKADWDVGITVDAIQLAPQMDALVIVSGDGDFVPLVEYAKTMCRVEVMSFGKSTSQHLREAVDEFVDISENTKRYLMTSKKGSRKNSQRNK